MARAAPRLSLVIAMLGTMVVLCGGLMVAMKFGEVKLKEAAQGKTTKKKNEPTGPYADRIRNLDTRVHSVTQGTQDDVAGGGLSEKTDPGLYLDVVSDEVLFSSRDKLPAVIGYAEFERPVDAALLIEEPETAETGEARIRVKSKKANTRLGWKGPNPQDQNQMRYYLNSTALRFVPEADLEKEGLGEQKKLLEKQ
jgi:peptide methionine sulfoxide reductase MsrB